MSNELVKKAIGEKANEGLQDLVTKLAINTLKGWVPGHVSGIEKQCQGQGLAMKRDLFSGEFLCVGPPGAFAAPPSPQVAQVANISAPVAPVYNTPTTNITINNPVAYIIPALPERRLSPKPPAPPPPPPVGTIPTPTLSEKSTFVQVALKDGKLGCLLHEPLNATPVVIEVPDRSRFIDTSDENQAVEGKKFINWLLGKRNQEKINITGDPAKDTAISLTQTGLFLLIKRKDLDSESEINPLFGTETFQVLVGDFLTRNRVQINPVTCLVPMNFSVLVTAPGEITVTEVLPNLIVGGVSGGVGGSETIDKIAACLGVDEYPASLPASLIAKDEGWLGNAIPNAPVQIPNLTRLISQFIKYFDEIAGQWEIPIEVKDADPLTPGEQPVGIKLPNIAEYAAESFLLQFRGAIDQATMLNMMTRILIEVGQIKQQDYRAYGLLQTLTDYLGFDYSETQKDLPLSFDPTKESLDELLKEIVVKVPYAEYKEKHDFRTDLRRIMESVAIIKAVHWQKVPGGNNAEGMKAHIMKTIKDRAKQIKEERDKNSDDFDAFVKDVEDGFPTTPGVTDPSQPYGKPYAQRPEIKKLKETP